MDDHSATTARSVSLLPANRQQQRGETTPNAPNHGETPESDSEEIERPKVLRISELGRTRRNKGKHGRSRPGGIRTPDQGIMSPLLSPLSYGPGSG